MIKAGEEWRFTYAKIRLSVHRGDTGMVDSVHAHIQGDAHSITLIASSSQRKSLGRWACFELKWVGVQWEGYDVCQGLGTDPPL